MASDDDRVFPIHAKSVPACDFAALLALDPGLEDAIGWCTDAAKYRALPMSPGDAKPPRCDLFDEDLGALIAADVIEPIPADDSFSPKQLLRTFSVLD